LTENKHKPTKQTKTRKQSETYETGILGTGQQARKVKRDKAAISVIVLYACGQFLGQGTRWGNMEDTVRHVDLRRQRLEFRVNWCHGNSPVIREQV
jgi:hypothetical protein